MGLQLAFGRDGDVDLWCVDRGFTKHGGLKFWVINGHWAGVYYRGRVYIGYDGDDNEEGAPYGRNYRGKLLWRGVTPFHDEDYSEAMSWLRTHLARKPELEAYFKRMEFSMAKLSFGEAVDVIDVENHNERVSALASAHFEMGKAIANQERLLEEMKAYRDELSQAGEQVEHLSDEDYAAIYNRSHKFTSIRF